MTDRFVQSRFAPTPIDQLFIDGLLPGLLLVVAEVNSCDIGGVVAMSRSKRTTRRDFMGSVGGAVASGMLAANPAALAKPSERPNILWIMTDEHRTDSLQCYGNSWARSPNLDRLAERGILFEQAFVQSPICVPSRASMLTGKYAHTCEVLNNSHNLNLTSWHRARMADAIEKVGEKVFEEKALTLGRQSLRRMFHEKFGAEVLPPPVARAGGWNAGIMQLANQLGIIGKGPDHRMFPEILAEHGYQTINIGKLHHRAPRPGFQRHLTVPDLEHAFWFGLHKSFDPADYGLIHHPSFPAIFAGRFPADASETTSAKWTNRAIDYLNNKVTAPFLLRLSLRSPHTPVLPPIPYHEMFDPKDMPIPMPSAEEIAGTSRYDRARLFQDGFNEEQRRQTWASYFGLAAFVDHEIGRLLRALAASPHSKNTIVVFTVDHGSHLGEHGLYQKSTFFDESVRVPFMLSWPGRIPTARVSDLVEMVDLAPTLLDLCEIDVPNDMAGRNLVPNGKSAGSSQREAAFSEIYAGKYDLQWLRGEPAGTVRRMIRTPEWNMSVYYPEDPLYGPDGSLYDLIEDPSETNNLYYQSKYRAVVTKLHKRLTEWVHS